MKFELDLRGADVLRRNLERVDKAVRKQGLAKAAKAGAQVVADRAEQLAPRRTGKLARRIHVEMQEQTPGFAEAAVGHHKDDFYGPFQELGVKPHQRFYGSKAKAKELGRRGRGRNAVDPRKFKPHPGNKAQPHLRPAFDEKRPEAEKRASDELSEVIMGAIRGGGS